MHSLSPVNPVAIPIWPEHSVHSPKDGSPLPALTFFHPVRFEKVRRAAVLICPGGGYGGLASHEGEPIAQLLALHGIVGVVLTYRVAPHRYPAPMLDAARAMRWLRAHSDQQMIDPHRIGILGFSAGGHLAATIATRPAQWADAHDELAPNFSARPDRLILGYPVTHFEERGHPGSGHHLLGDKATLSQKQELATHLHVNADTPPTFIFHTANDQPVPVDNSLLLAQAFTKHQVPFALHIFPDGPHGVGLALDRPQLREWPNLMMQWLSDWTAGYR